jgi:DNA-binding response OmpR family regulator
MSTILLIHDNAEVVRTISGVLTAAAFRCVTAHTAAEGLRLCDEEWPAVVIADPQLHLDDGSLLIEIIRCSSAVPILVVAGSPDDYTDTVRLLGDVGALRKPIDSIALLRNVRARCSPSWQIRASVNRAGELTNRPAWAA